MLAMGLPRGELREELAEEERVVVHAYQIRLRGVPARKPTRRTGRLARFQDPRRIERRRDRPEFVPQIERDQAVDQSRLLDLRGMPAPGDHDLAHVRDASGGPDRAGDVRKNPVVGAPDQQGGRHHARQERGHRMADGAPQGLDHAELPPPVLELPAERLDHLVRGEMSVEKDRLDQGIVVAPPDPFDDRKVLVPMEARGADQDQPVDTLRMSNRIGQDDLAAEARADEVVRGTLDEIVQVGAETLGQVIDRNLAAGLDVAVEGPAVIDQDLRYLHVEMPRQVHPVGEPALRLLGQSVDEDQGSPPLVVIEHRGQVEPSSDVGRHDDHLFRMAFGRTAGQDGCPRRESGRSHKRQCLIRPRS